jgi:hypothetical protein
MLIHLDLLRFSKYASCGETVLNVCHAGSVMDGKCLTLTGTELDVTSCISPPASNQKWAVSTPAAGSNASVIKAAGGGGQCVALRTTPPYNADPPLSRPGGFAYPGTMVVGDGSMTRAENQVHFAGWCSACALMHFVYWLVA